MPGPAVISCVLFTWLMGMGCGEALGYDDYSSVKNEETEVEIQKVEVYEVPWIGDQQPQNSYGPPQQQYGPPLQTYNSPPQSNGLPPQTYGPPSQEYGPPPQEYGPPPQEYGPPPQEYGPPPQEYGPPEQTSTDYPDLTTTLSSNSTTNTTSNNSTQNQTAKLREISGVSDSGQYYIYHPNGLLQKVIYLTEDDSKNMAFSARLKYKNVDPIREPIYTYDPDTYVFSRLNRK